MTQLDELVNEVLVASQIKGRSNRLANELASERANVEHL